MHRRLFVKTAGAGLAMSLVRSAVADENKGNSPRVMTVTGEVAADQLGRMLPHEHVMVDFVGAGRVSPDRYDAGEVFEVMLPHVKRAKELGCRAIAECTPVYLGRDPELLKRLSQATEVRWLTNWVHAQNERNHEIHIEVGRRGAWVEFDSVGPSSVARHVELVLNMKRADLLDRVLISHDAGWYSVGEPRGGKVRGYDTLFTQFLPALKNAGFSEEVIRQLTVCNPARAFSISVRSTRNE